MEAISGDLTFTYGLYDAECDVNGHFVWAKGHFGLRGNAGGRFYAARICYYGDAGTLQLNAASGWKSEVLLQKGWHTYALDLGAAQGQEVHFAVNPIIPVQTDQRELGVMIRRFQCLRDREAYDRVSRALDNKRLNDKEFLEGRIILRSHPSLLRLATHSQCNIIPRCVYCDWESAKRDESDSDLIFSLPTLESMGGFFRHAAGIGELSYGEPMLSPHFSTLLEVLRGWGKPISMASNGQAMGPQVRRAMLGMDVELYISIDAGTDEGYRRYRNERFAEVVENVRALCREKKEHRNLPNVIVTYIAMRSNRSEIDAFLALMKDIGVDGVRIMNLDPYPHLTGRAETHNGFRFLYRDEALSYQELEEFVERARALATQRSLSLLAVTDFACERGPGGLPVCSEPWKTINPLKRGLVVCCFNKSTTVAKWSERRGRTMEQFLSDIWNGPTYQEIRSALAAGELHPICRQPNNCPIAAGLRRAEGE